ncbi:putative metal ion transporter [Dioszegia hungarica]|uniref:Cytochrome c oxidase assembly protein COX19 n=1 Tax=Dioszegia hungarica TaxID=4972 RepID=A0AA38LV91_9TREE|nr:putative metal ion transporter [Dioszegia hungarica]KAI9636283.1 putative metal ion transporter [Dioszegia hungarica]
MSFGRPGTFDNWKVSPPARGSFPLDHDGECKTFMISYLKCLKANAADNGVCRPESRKYLECRMDHGLMTRDDMANLGLGDVGTQHTASAPINPPDAATSTTRI